MLKKLGNKKAKAAAAFFAGGLVIAAVWLWGGFFLALAGELIDNFTDTSRVGDTWNVEVDTGAGEVRLSLRSCDSDVWICAASTTCVNALGDGEYIIVASTTISGTRQWKTEQTACDIPQCGQDGGQDGDNLVADNTVSFASYPARQACKEIGGRLPTVAELQCIYTNRASLNNNFGTGYYWSSTEYSSTDARRVGFSDGGTYSNGKTDADSVRCVRGW